MLPYKSIIDIQKSCETPVYLQIANALIIHIKKGLIKPATKLPGTRVLSGLLEVHRKTVVSAYNELYAQGWIELLPSKGTFVSKVIPEISPKKIKENQIKTANYPHQTGYAIKKNQLLAIPALTAVNQKGFNDGFPDVRLAPVEMLARNYRNILRRGFQKNYLSYSDTTGNDFLRKILAEYLSQSRGLQISKDNVLITRGSQMGIYLATQILLEKGDKVIVGETSYFVANMTFLNAGAELLKIPVDEYGLCVDEIENICQKYSIRMMYLTSHHHYPTTVSLCAERRVRLLHLAEKYGFIILEDDYDYDFHYSSSPILPLASADAQGMVIYTGSLCKTIFPAIRLGYVVAPENLIQELRYLRRIIDRQGDNILEQAVAELFTEGEVKRHLKKSLRAYHQRRDFFCALLADKLNDLLEFKIPDGGMAVWAKFDKSIDLVTLSEKAYKAGFLINNGQNYNPDHQNLNATRLGFASLELAEIEEATEILCQLIKK